MSTTRSPAALVLENTPRNVPAPGHNTPMPFTAAISRTCARPSLLSTIVQLINSPSGFSGQRSAFRLYSCSLMPQTAGAWPTDRKSTRLNSSHDQISYAVFCLKKKKIVTHKREHCDHIHAIVKVLLNHHHFQLQSPRLSVHHSVFPIELQLFIFIFYDIPYTHM